MILERIHWRAKLYIIAKLIPFVNFTPRSRVIYNMLFLGYAMIFESQQKMLFHFR